MTSSLLTVSGVSGHLGRFAASHLLDLGVPHLRGTSRTPSHASDLAARGLDVRLADFGDPRSLDDAWGGTGRLLLVSTGAEHAGPRRVRQQLAALDAAQRAGAHHVVYTSLQRAGDSPLKALVADHAATEAALRDAPMAHTVLRHAFYLEMLLTTLPPAIASGRFVTAAGGGAIAYVARADCARAAAEALRQPFDGRRTLDVTGPAAVTADDLVATANEVLGTSITVERVDPDDLQRRMAAAGLPPPLAAVLADIDRGVARGAMDTVSGGVEALTGTAPEGVAAFLARHREVLLPPAGQRG
ncbi:NAD(P)H-binding protein [Piscinibacter gummiphilus]|uniref:Uncharacterized protein n=1 Tax=Piscinibacter gummiphilus TaxID=946333 RepID=A0A1W6L2X3_9BURK|nr:NAD(P)H-binding protein [Piscinibacter gummiphilus]ARN18536.1 hypothetical protein A4W93_00600 [Piscinibacter gummiphilus]ATU63163.1 NAD(P)-dependent oxidoreductase [Piscinibacter gummiphilus]GLS95483.1 NAD(P)-dependent oxidoreductase [Piscinibacter gummiphilus]